MADYRCSVKPRLSRGKGASVARAVGYIARDKVEDERTGERYDYSRNQDKALWTGIYAPSKAPEWAHDLQKLTTEIERAEKRKDAQLALPIELSLSHELTLEQNRWMMQDFIKENFTRHGYATIAAIHEPPHGGDPRNIHAHLLVTLRTIDENGFAQTKKEQQENYMARSERVEVLRQSWEKHLKHHLERHGFEKEAAEVSCKSLKDRGIDREAQQHLGPAAAQMERKGKKTERGDINRAIEDSNKQREQLKTAEKEVSQAIAEVQRKLDTEAKRQQVEAERRAQVLRARDAAAAQAINSAWTSAPRDAMAFMINLNERGLYVAQDKHGYYAAVEKNGYAHRLPDKEMQQAIDGLRGANSSLIIPSLEGQRDQLADERDREQQRRSMHLGATLYNHASMPLMQRDALLHIQDVHRQQEAARQRQERERRARERQEAAERQQPTRQRQKTERQPSRDQQAAAERQRQEAERQRQTQERQKAAAERQRQQEVERQRQAQEQQKREAEQQQRQREERERMTAKEPPIEQQAQAKEDKRSRTEQTEYQQRRAERERLREQLGLRQQGGRERGGDDGGRERER